MEANSINKILVPVDLSPLSASLLSYVISINKNIGAELVLYHLSNSKDLEGYQSKRHDPTINPEVDLKQLITTAKQNDNFLRITYVVQNGSSVERNVVKFAEEQNIDLLN